jgi:cell division protease FtsH
MICNWGMSRELGPQTFGAQEELLFLGREVARNQDFSEETSRRIDQEVNQLLREAYERAREIIQARRAELDLTAKLLLERETLDGRDIEEILKFGRCLSDEERVQADAEAQTSAKPQSQPKSAVQPAPDQPAPAIVPGHPQPA